MMNKETIDSQQNLEKFISEIKILSNTDNSNIIKLSYVSLNGKYCKSYGRIENVIYYVMEIAEYGELFNFIE